jgi:hypothetical protein
LAYDSEEESFQEVGWEGVGYAADLQNLMADWIAQKVPAGKPH